MEGSPDGGEEVKLVQEGRFPAQAPVLKDEDAARGGARRHGHGGALSPSSRMRDDNVRK